MTERKNNMNMTKKKKQLTLRLPDEVYGQLQQESERKHITITELINIILYFHFENVAQE